MPCISLLAEKILYHACVQFKSPLRTTYMRVAKQTAFVWIVLALPYFALAIKCNTTLLTCKEVAGATHTLVIVVEEVTDIIRS